MLPSNIFLHPHIALHTCVLTRTLVPSFVCVCVCPAYSCACVYLPLTLVCVLFPAHSAHECSCVLLQPSALHTVSQSGYKQKAGVIMVTAALRLAGTEGQGWKSELTLLLGSGDKACWNSESQLLPELYCNFLGPRALEVFRNQRGDLQPVLARGTRGLQNTGALCSGGPVIQGTDNFPCKWQ